MSQIEQRTPQYSTRLSRSFQLDPGLPETDFAAGGADFTPLF